MTEREAPYFVNHDRRDRFPWSIYHRELQRGIADAIWDHRPAPQVLVVGCGLEPFVPDSPPGVVFYGCDLDARAIEECRRRHPEMAARLAVCPGPLELPSEGEMNRDFDVVVAKEVIEHLFDPVPWAQALARRVAVKGELVLTTPNYGRWSPLPLLERTVLEWIARRDGYSRAHIHPSKFDRRRLEILELDAGMSLVSVTVARTGLHLTGRWRRSAPVQ